MTLNKKSTENEFARFYNSLIESKPFSKKGYGWKWTWETIQHYA